MIACIRLHSYVSSFMFPAIRYLRALPTIRMHPELDERTLDIVHSLIGIKSSGYKHLLDHELHNFYKLNVSYVTAYIISSDDVCCNIRNVKFIKVMQFKQMFVIAVCVLFLLELTSSTRDS